MLTQIIADQRAWRSGTIDNPHSWYLSIPPQCVEALDTVVQALRQRPRPRTTLRVTDFPLGVCRDDLHPARVALREGRGFVILDGIPAGRYASEELQVLYWLLGQCLGEPMEQNVEGTLLYDVLDTGQDVRSGARFSVTRYESTFHTDNSFGTHVTDYVGLLCLNQARSGGLNQVVSAWTVHNELLRQDAGALEVLYGRFHLDRRAGIRLGEAPTIRSPVFDWDGQELTCRYMRYWIDVGHDKAGQPLTANQLRALDLLDTVLGRRDLRVEFSLKPGDMFFINNRWILHNRTAFEDHPEPECRRHLVRLWLSARPDR